MLFIKLTRYDLVGDVAARSLIAGPFEDEIDAKYHCKQLALQDRQSSYKVVDCEWVITVVRPAEVVSWHDTEVEALESQLALADTGSTHKPLGDQWVVMTVKPPEVISWHETEEDCKVNAAAIQRMDYDSVVEAKHWPLQ